MDHSNRFCDKPSTCSLPIVADSKSCERSINTFENSQATCDVPTNNWRTTDTFANQVHFQGTSERWSTSGDLSSTANAEKGSEPNRALGGLKPRLDHDERIQQRNSDVTVELPRGTPSFVNMVHTTSVCAILSAMIPMYSSNSWLLKWRMCAKIPRLIYGNPGLIMLLSGSSNRRVPFGNGPYPFQRTSWGDALKPWRSGRLFSPLEFNYLKTDTSNGYKPMTKWQYRCPCQ